MEAIAKYKIGNVGWDINPTPHGASGMWRVICTCPRNSIQESSSKWVREQEFISGKMFSVPFLPSMSRLPRCFESLLLLRYTSYV